MEKASFAEALAEGYFDQEAHNYAKSLSAGKLFLFAFANFAFVFWGVSLQEQVLSEVAKNQAVIMIALAVLAFAFDFMAAVFLTTLQSFGEKRTKKGWEEASKWLAFRRHMREYKKTKNYSIDSVILWEKYLIYGTLFGVSMKALSQLPVKFTAADAKTLGTYWAINDLGDLDKGFVNLDSLNSAAFGQSLSSMGSAFTGLAKFFWRWGGRRRWWRRWSWLGFIFIDFFNFKKAKSLICQIQDFVLKSLGNEFT